MAEVKSVNDTKVVFVGKAWVNQTKEVKDVNGVIIKTPKDYLKLTIDKGIELVLHSNDSLELWENNKRAGINAKTNAEYRDADYRVSIRIPVAPVAAA